MGGESINYSIEELTMLVVNYFLRARAPAAATDTTAIATAAPTKSAAPVSGFAFSASTSTSGSSSMNSSRTEAYTKRMIGNSGVSATAQKMIEQYRNNIRAINREIIDKLSILFMGLY